MRQARGIVAIGMKATGFVALGVFIAKGIFAIGYKSIGIAAVGLDALEIISLYR